MKKIFSFLPLLFLGFGLLFSGCIDDKFDAPPVDGVDPDIATNATIQDILNLATPGEIKEITEDLVFSGIVVSSDREGNFYKSLVIQDETAGVRFSINASGLFNDYMQFRRVFVKAKGLFIGDYHGLPTIGSGIGQTSSGNVTIERIPSILLPEHLFKGMKNRPSPVQEVTIAELPTVGTNKLVRIIDVEFVAGDLGLTMAEASQDANRTIVDCSAGNTMIFRTSRYSDFADAAVPTGNGSIEAVTSSYNGDYQLTLNQYADLDMTGERCTGGGGPGGWTLLGTSAIVDEVDDNFETLPDGDDAQITGWINATDIANGRYWRAKEFSNNTYIQATAHNDNNPSTHNWMITPGVTNIGSKKLSFKSSWGFGGLEHVLKVFVSTDFNGEDIAGATWTEINPTVATSATPEHQWVESGIYDMSAFSGTGYVAFEYTGAANSNPSALRVDDVVINDTGVGTGGGTGGGEVTHVGNWYLRGTSAEVSSINEPFDDITENVDYEKEGWLNTVENDENGRFWVGGTYNDDKYLKASAYQYGANLHQMLITPGVTNIGSKTLSFRAAMHHHAGDVLRILISTDFDGSNIDDATWVELSATLPGSAQSNYDWIDSGNIDLSAYSGTGYIAFEYNGTATATTGYHLDDVVVQ